MGQKFRKHPRIKNRKLSIIDLLQVVKNKARCFHSNTITTSSLYSLNGKLSKEELYQLRLAVYHIQSGESDRELNEVCDTLIEKYKQH